MLAHGVANQQNRGVALLEGTLSAITDLSPYHYWTMETSSTNEGSHTATLDVKNGITLVESAPFSEVTLFDDSTDNRRSSSTAVPMGATTWTLGAWVRFTGVYTDNLQIISEHGGSSSAFNSREFVLAMSRNAGGDGYAPYWQYYHTNNSRTTVDLNSGDYDITDTDWHHVMAARGPGFHRIWLDGQLIETSDSESSSVVDTNDFYMTGQVRGGGGSVGMEMAHYAHFTYELSDANVLSIANAAGLSYPTWP